MSDTRNSILRYKHKLPAMRIKITKLLILILGTFAFLGCMPSSANVGGVISTGEKVIRDQETTTETVPNCSGANTNTTKRPSRSVVTAHSVEWEINGQVGVGLTIGEGVVPGGLNLEGALGSALMGGLDTNIEQGDEWELIAEPDSIHEFTIMWREEWQPGYIEAVLPNGNGVEVNVLYRTGIRSDIIGDRILDCSGNPKYSADEDGAESIEPPPSAREETVPPISTTVLPSRTPSVDSFSGFKVKADVWKNGTGIFVSEGDIVHIEYLEGQWTGDKSKPGLVAGCGFTWDDPDPNNVWLFPPEQRGAALVGYIDNNPFFIGCSPTDIFANTDGEIFLGMSDCQGCYWDNTGELSVKIVVQRHQ